ncbi:chemotaxis protein CheY [Porphyromonadaceae bacterium COT-184 OH4590]|nr:chemotaxis protein CheY [Porphyromonadaceae bacterium COT-184 OH4590]
MGKQGRILWVDDEIDLLKSYFMFLADKGYDVEKATNGVDALELINTQNFDIVFLDENMPGLSGLDTLSQIKQTKPNMPIVMITKNEAENIMDLAIGKKIADFLTKPVNPSQILLALKKHLHKSTIVKEQTTSEYSSEFLQINSQISAADSDQDFFELYRQLTFWDLRLDETQNELYNILMSQKEEANFAFCKYISKNYLSWFAKPESRPLMSPDIFKTQVFPFLDNGEKVFLIVIDNFRYDQWKMVQQIIEEFFTIEKEMLYYSILPTTTQYARNSLMSGLMPLQIKEMYPQFWVDDTEEESKNLYEENLIEMLLQRYRKNINFSYHKINSSQEGEKLVEKLPQLKDNQLNVCVLNFIDMLSHSRTEMRVIKEIARSETAYRALSVNWFKYSPTLQMFKDLATSDYKVIVTTDHGTVSVNKPIKVIGDKNTTTNLRYKVGKALNYNKNEVFDVTTPQKAMLPCPNVSSTYIFAKNRNFMAYPNNYNYYATYFKDSFQHGGISLEEMVIPLAVLKGKN